MKRRLMSFVTLSKFSTNTVLRSLAFVALLTGVSGIQAADLQPQLADKGTDSATSENQAVGQIIQSLLNNIQKAQLDFEFEGSVENEVGLVTSLLNITGLVQFKEDISQDIKISDKSNDKTMTSLTPKLQLGLKGLFVDARYTEQNKIMKASVHFYSGYDSSRSLWIPKPLTATISNQLNSNLLTLRLHSIEFAQKPDPTNVDRRLVSGTCKSDKQIFDIPTGKNTIKPVRCQYEGFLGKDNQYKINFKYLNQ
jgi:hypothetical protein